MEVLIFLELNFFSACKKSTRFFKEDLSDGNVSSSTTTKKVFKENSDDSNSMFVEDTDSDSDVYLPTPPLVCTPEKMKQHQRKRDILQLKFHLMRALRLLCLPVKESFLNQTLQLIKWFRNIS